MALSKLSIILLLAFAISSIWLLEVSGAGGHGSSSSRKSDASDVQQVRRDRGEGGSRDRDEEERSGTRSVGRSVSRRRDSRSRHSRTSGSRSGSRSRSASRSHSGSSRSSSRSVSRSPSGRRRTHHDKAESSSSKSRGKKPQHNPSKGKPAHRSSRRPEKSSNEMSRSARDKEGEDVLGNLPKLPKRRKSRRKEAGSSQIQFNEEQESAIREMLEQRNDRDFSDDEVTSSRSLEELKIRLKQNLDDCQHLSSQPLFRKWLRQRNRYLDEAISRQELRELTFDVQQLRKNTAEKVRQIMAREIADGNEERNRQATRKRMEARMPALQGLSG